MECSWSPNCVHGGHAGSIIVTGNQLRHDLHKWLSPPDPSTSHNVACSAHHEGTATWFFNGRTYKEWKSESSGSDSLLWIHGKRAPLSHSTARHHIITSLIYSWLRQEHTLVRRPFAVLSKITEPVVVFQFLDHSRHRGNVRCWSSLDGTFLFRLSGRQETTLG